MITSKVLTNNIQTKWDENFQAMETIKVEIKEYFKEFNYVHMQKWTMESKM
jgi:hypothetical protein